jgi:hypothetical protein
MDSLLNIINKGLNQKLTENDTYELVLDYYRVINGERQYMYNILKYYNESGEINACGYNNNQIFISQCYFIRIVIEALNNGIIDSDTFLIAAISNLQSPEGLLLIAILLRFSPAKDTLNLYVTMKGQGVVHIILFTVMYLQDKVPEDLITTALCVMTLLGVSTNAYAFNQKSSDSYGVKSSDRSGRISVAEWLVNHGFNDFTSTPDFMMQYFTTDDIINIGTMTDTRELAFPEGITEQVIEYITDGIIESPQSTLPGPDLSMVLLYNAYECQKYVSLTNCMVKGENLQLKMCIECMAPEMFKSLFDKGFRLTYFGTNRLLLYLKSTAVGRKSEESRIPKLIYLSMLKHAVNKGAKLDLEQFSIVKTYLEDVSQEIEDIYSKPEWVKSCSGSESVPLPTIVKELAYSLDIDLTKSKTEICNNLNNLSRQNPDAIVNAATTRQENKMSGELLNVKDYVKGRKEVKCVNAPSINGDPLEYANDSLVYYKDKSNQTWCFTPNVFIDKINQPFNDYNQEPLPRHVVAKMISVVSFLEQLNINPKHIVPIGKALDRLNEEDSISDKASNRVIEYVVHYANNEGVYKRDLQALNIEQMYNILEMIDYTQDYLEMLTYSHRFITFCKALYNFLKKNPENNEPLMNSIKDLTLR